MNSFSLAIIILGIFNIVICLLAAILLITLRVNKTKSLLEIKQLQQDCKHKLDEREETYHTNKAIREHQKRSLLIKLQDQELNAIRLRVQDKLSEFGVTASGFKEFAHLAVESLAEEFKLYHVALFQVDAAREFAQMIAGTGEGGKMMVEREHRLSLKQRPSAIQTSITKTAICFDVFDLPLMGVFYSSVSTDLENKSIGPFEFLEQGGFGCPDFPETHQRLILPLRTGHETIGALDIHTSAIDMGRESAELLLPIADQIAKIYQTFPASEVHHQEDIE